MAVHADQITSLGRNAGKGLWRGRACLGLCSALVIYQGICQGFVREPKERFGSDLGVLCSAHTSGDAAAGQQRGGTKRLGGAGAAEGSFRINIHPLLP